MLLATLATPSSPIQVSTKNTGLNEKHFHQFTTKNCTLYTAHSTSNIANYKNSTLFSGQTTNLFSISLINLNHTAQSTTFYGTSSYCAPWATLLSDAPTYLPNKI